MSPNALQHASPSNSSVNAAQNELFAFLSLLKPMRAAGFEKVRVGASDDGGYVMVADFDPAVPCYSIGIGEDVSWDLDLAERGLSIFQYDHTVAGPPISHPNFRFHKYGVSDDPDWSDELKSLEEILKDNGHSQATDLILKIDVEGAEWVLIDKLPRDFLRPFRQILCEFHWLDNLNDAVFRQRAIRVFETLNATHGVVHVHANNFAPLGVVEGVPVAGVIEVSFAARDRYDLIESGEIFPTPLDKPNNPEKPDIFLGDFRYRDIGSVAVAPAAAVETGIAAASLPAVDIELLADQLSPLIATKLLTTPRVFGDPARLTLGPGCNPVNTLFNLVSGTVSVGAYAFFGHDVRVLTGTHDVSAQGLDRQLAVPSEGRDIVIGEGAWIGSGATILGPARIGAHAVVGAGSVVIGDVEEGWFYAGAPARRIRSVDGEDTEIA